MMGSTALLLAALAASVACPSRAQTPPTDRPHFVVEPRNVTEQVGGTATLECQVSSLSDSQEVAWMKEARFQTSGRSLLTADPDRLSRIVVEDAASGGGLRFNLVFHGVRPEDAGVYHCYAVEFWELNQRWFLRSRPARLTVVAPAARPSVRCLRPSPQRLSRAALTGRDAAVGCTVLNNRPGTVVKLLDSSGLVLAENLTDTTEPYTLRLSADAARLRREKVTCTIEFSAGEGEGGPARRSCSMGPFIELPPVINRTRISLDLVPGSDAHLPCPGYEGTGRVPAVTTTPEPPRWALDPPLLAHRYSLSPDGMKITIWRVTPEDNGLVVSCREPDDGRGGGGRTVDMEVRVMKAAPAESGGSPDAPDRERGVTGGERARVGGHATQQPVIGQAAWSVLRGSVDGERLKPAPPSSGPGHDHQPAAVVSGADRRRPATSTPGATATPVPPVGGVRVTDNGTRTASSPGGEAASNASTLAPVTEQPSFRLSPLVIVAICEAGMSVIILVIAFAVLCQCCCRDQTKAGVRGDKDLNLAAASFGKPSATPTLLTYKSTVSPPITATTTATTTADKSPTPPDLSQKKLPPIPPGAAYARTEGLPGAKKVLTDTSDLPPPGSWVFSAVNSESGEAEPTTTTATATATATEGDPGHDIYVAMV